MRLEITQDELPKALKYLAHFVPQAGRRFMPSLARLENDWCNIMAEF